MKSLFIFLLLTILMEINVSAQQKKVEINLDKNWKFQMDRSGFGVTKKWFEFKNLEELKGMMNINVPGFWDEQINRVYIGSGWYFNEFEIKEIPESNLAIKFEGVDDNAQVWINGRLVGEHKGYSEPFFFDITSYVQTGLNTLTVLVENTGGPGGIYKEVKIMSYLNTDDLYKTKFSEMNSRNSEEWIKSGIIYELYPRAFTKEGTFNAIIPYLADLKELGVNIIWIMPVNPIGEIKRKGTLGSPYSVKDFMGINPEYGNEADFRNLVKEIHRAGMKVIIDVVLNHSAWDNNLIKTNPDFYTKNKKKEIISPNSDWTDVADFNYDNKKLRKYMTDVLKYWVREFDIDGFRCDVAELVPTDFWESARKELDKIKPMFILSEGTLPEHHLKAFDMTYSWNVYDVLNDFVKGNKNANEIRQILKMETYQYPKNALRMRFNENHDKQRASKVFGDEGALITAALVNTIPGVPLIYNGQEFGNTVFASLFEKSEIDREYNSRAGKFLDFYKKIFKLRDMNKSLEKGTINFLNSDNDLLIYTRNYKDQNSLIILNFSQHFKNISIEDLLKATKDNKPDFERAITHNVKINTERMGRPASTDIEIEPLGFLIIEY